MLAIVCTCCFYWSSMTTEIEDEHLHKHLVTVAVVEGEKIFQDLL